MPVITADEQCLRINLINYLTYNIYWNGMVDKYGVQNFKSLEDVFAQ